MGGYRKPEERKRFHCQKITEDERHFLLKCPLYNELREDIYGKITLMDSNFKFKRSQEDQLFYLLINPPRDLQKIVAKYVYDYFELRKIEKMKQGQT